MSDTANKAAEPGGQVQLLSPAEKNQQAVYDFKITYEEMQWLIIVWVLNEKGFDETKQTTVPEVTKNLTWLSIRASMDADRNFCSIQWNLSGINIFRERICVYYICIWASLVAQWSRICLQWRRCRFNPWVRKIPWRRKWQPTPLFLPVKSHGQRNLAGYIVHGVAKNQTQFID